MPESIVETGDGAILIANGIDPVLQWDGYAPMTRMAGVSPPLTAVTLGQSGTGTISGTYQAYLRFVDSDGKYSNLSPVSASVVVASALYINYTNVQVPTQADVVRRQILRNTNGQADTYYVDIDTTDLGSSAFLSANDDATLRTQEAAPLFDDAGNDIINVHTPPPNYKPFMAWHQNRMYFAGVRPYRQGSVSFAQGSAVVTGHQTEWPASLQGRLIYIDGADKAYEISTVNVASQTIGLVQAIQAPSQRYSAYAIRPSLIESNTGYFSEANDPVGVPATNAFTVPTDGDEVTGLMNFQSFLYFLKRRRMYRLTTRVDPLTDGHVYLGINRGCVNDRCWVIANEVAYLLDEGGVYAFTGESGDSASAMIQDLFRRDGISNLRINWAASDYFHASHSPQEEVIRWHVAIGEDSIPRHALVYGYNQGRWSIDEYPYPIGGSCLGRAAGLAGSNSTGTEQVYFGSYAKRVFAISADTFDGIVSKDAARGRLLSCGVWSAVLDRATTSSMVGSTIAITTGRARRSVRKIVEVSAQTVYFDRPLDVVGDARDVYQIGAYWMTYRSRRLRYADRSEKREGRNCEVAYYPVPRLALRQSIGLALIDDYNKNPKTIGRRMDQGASSTFLAEYGADVQELYVDDGGTQVFNFSGGRESQTNALTAVVVGLNGASGPGRVRINSILVGGVR